MYSAACEAEPPHELPDKDVLDLAIEFAQVERDLQEIDRARCAPFNRQSFMLQAVVLVPCTVCQSVRRLRGLHACASLAERGRCVVSHNVLSAAAHHAIVDIVA